MLPVLAVFSLFLINATPPVPIESVQSNAVQMQIVRDEVSWTWADFGASVVGGAAGGAAAGAVAGAWACGVGAGPGAVTGGVAGAVGGAVGYAAAQAFGYFFGDSNTVSAQQDVLQPYVASAIN